MVNGKRGRAGFKLTKMETIIEMINIALANKDLSLEINCDNTVTTLIRTGWLKSEIKHWSNEENDVDGTLEQGLHYLQSLKESVNEYRAKQDMGGV